jgi:hypothetical protein
MKKLLINEIQEGIIKKRLKESLDCDIKKASKPYVINPEKVLIVKRFLDNGFRKGQYEAIGNDGFPHITPIFAMMSSNGEVLKNMMQEELVDLLIEKYKKMFTDENERSLFFNQVLSDWYNDKIGLFGNLSVNILK